MEVVEPDEILIGGPVTPFARGELLHVQIALHIDAKPEALTVVVDDELVGPTAEIPTIRTPDANRVPAAFKLIHPRVAVTGSAGQFR